MSVTVSMHCFLGDFICAEPSLREICKKHQDEEIVVQAPFKEFLCDYPFTLSFAQLSAPPRYRLICNGNGHLVHQVARMNNLHLECDIPRLPIQTIPHLNEPYFLICAEASTPDRHWQMEKWEELIEKLDAPVYQIGKWNKVVLNNAKTDFLGKKLDPSMLASLIKFSKAFITVDSGLSHLSAAIQKPYVVLMDKIPSAWRMHQGLTRAINKNDIKKITVDEVLDTSQLG